MRKNVLAFLIVGLLALILSSCGGGYSAGGELVGVPERGRYFEPDPFGMLFVPQGSFTMGPSDQDVAWAQNAMSRVVSIDAYWMDETEITNNEYRQFVYWVRDSIMRRKLGEQLEQYLISQDEFGNPIDPPLINWEEGIDFKNQETMEILNELYYQPSERFFGRKELDTRKLIYEYFWIDLQQAAKKANRYDFEKKQYPTDGFVVNTKGEKVKINDRGAFVMRDWVPAYPDTLCWILDFTYSFNEPYANMYFWHPAFDNYPVVGVSWKQATAFSIWRTQLLNDALMKMGDYYVHDYRLPIEAEWEYAARGGLDHSMYAWGGMYCRNKLGCFLANFKPLRGNYTDDGSLITAPVASYEPNEYGLYDMAGNVAEWTSNAYDESSYIFSHDMNPDYKYNALPNDPPVMKRKVIRGGSWKDISYFMQNGTRTYEYQDTAKSYVGFRCVRSFLGSSQ